MFPKRDNYAIMAAQARLLFQHYDQSAIIAHAPVKHDERFLYLKVLDRVCRIDRKTGLHAWRESDTWHPSLSFNETLTIFDYLCDAKPNRCLSGEFAAMSNFGNQFHAGLLSAPTPLETAIDHDPNGFRRACAQLHAAPWSYGDIGYVIPFFPDLPVAVQFWHSDEDFPPQLKWFWDRQSLDFLRYETMYYAIGILTARIAELMQNSQRTLT